MPKKINVKFRGNRRVSGGSEDNNTSVVSPPVVPTTPVPDTGGVANKNEVDYDFTKLRWWIPTFHEIGIFLLFIFLTYWVIQIYQYNKVETNIIQNSRCYRDKHSIKEGGIQYVTATNARNEPLYTVGYNLSGKQTSLECACNTGNIMNTFNGIPIYDMSTNSISKNTTKQCSCDSDLLGASPNVYYNGYPDIVKFMNSTSSSTAQDLNKDNTIDRSYFLGGK
jgi:hypothetical protein